MNRLLKLITFLSIFCASFNSISADEIAYYEEVKDSVNHPEKILIDVREPKELEETGKYPDAINIHVTQLESAFNLSPEEFREKFNRSKPDLTDPIIFVCKKGIRAKQAYIDFTAKGYTNVKYYKGSWNEWCIIENLTCYENP